MTREQELLWLRVAFLLILIIGLAFPLLWIVDIPIYRRIKKLG